MTILAIIGGETATLDEFLSTSTDATFANSSVKAHTGNRSIKMSAVAGGYGYGVLDVASQAIKRISVYVYIDSLTSGNFQCIGYGSLGWGVQINSDRTITLTEGSTDRDTSSEIIPLDEWTRISLSVDAAGIAKAYIEGLEVCTYDGTATYIEPWIGVSQTAFVVIYFDDIVVDDVQSTDDMGDYRIAFAAANGSSTAYYEWTGSPVGGDSDRWQNIDEIPVSLTDYNWYEVDGTTKREAWKYEDCSALSIAAGDEISAVSMWWNYETDGGALNYATIYYPGSGGWIEDWAIDDPKVPTWLNVFVPYSDLNHTYFDNFSVGMGTNDANKDIWCYGCYLMVAYKVVPTTTTRVQAILI